MIGRVGPCRQFRKERPCSRWDCGVLLVSGFAKSQVCTMFPHSCKAVVKERHVTVVPSTKAWP